jgi:hypothetical protein
MEILNQMNKKTRIIAAFSLIGCSLILYFIIQNVICFGFMIDYTLDPNAGCNSILNGIAAPICSGTLMMIGLIILAHAIGEQANSEVSISSMQAVPNLSESNNEIRDEKAESQQGIGWAFVFSSFGFFSLVLVIGGGLWLIVGILEALSNSGNYDYSENIWRTMLLLFKFSFWGFIMGLIMLARPWKFLPKK